MSKKAKRKKNKKQLCPPLCALDKGIYSAIFLLTLISVVITAFLFEYLSDIIAFGHTGTVAYRKEASFLFVLPLLLHILTAAFVIITAGVESRTPLFGSKSIKYGEPPYKKDCIPVFRRKKYNAKLKPSQKKLIYSVTAVWCVLLLIFVGITPLGLYSRTALYEDNHIEKFNLLNSVENTYTAEDFDSLTITAQQYTRYSAKGGAMVRWQYAITIRLNNGEEVSFSNDSFASGSTAATDASLDRMLEIKELFDTEDITIEGINYIDKVVDYLNMNNNQQEKLDKLFS